MSSKTVKRIPLNLNADERRLLLTVGDRGVMSMDKLVLFLVTPYDGRDAEENLKATVGILRNYRLIEDKPGGKVGLTPAGQMEYKMLKELGAEQ
ncbi:MAG: hypothetical protein KGH98_03855 [Candidatus Micrarchaeota archaeon]|nr:hypothetical protein [Candidatus Micrarchaeota archaeon]